jgi:glutamate-1-semialdehyde 2,1-aminomutase
MDGLQKSSIGHGLEGTVVGHPSMFSVYIGEGTPTEYRHVAGHDSRVYDATIMRMIEMGVMPCPDALETWFVCGAHTDDDVEVTLEVFDQALGEVLVESHRRPWSTGGVMDGDPGRHVPRISMRSFR